MRELNTKLYLVAGVITVSVFLLGMMLGIVFEGKRVGHIDQQSRSQRLDFGSLQLQFQYITQLNQEKNCPALLGAMNEYFNRLAITEERLTNYQKDAKLDRGEFDLLKREYTQAEIGYWMLVNKIKETCSTDSVTALYFYSDDDECPDCGSQAFVLGYLKDLLKDRFLVFSIDTQLENEAMINMLRSTFNITRYPTVVVGNRVFSGLADKDALLKEACAGFESEVKECS